MRIFCIVLCALLITGCASVLDTMKPRDSVSAINANPQTYLGRSVRVEGRVTDTINVFWRGGVAYRIFESRFDSIWVFTKAPEPQRGTRLLVQGKLDTGSFLANKLIGHIIMEEKREVIGRED